MSKCAPAEAGSAGDGMMTFRYFAPNDMQFPEDVLQAAHAQGAAWQAISMCLAGSKGKSWKG